MGWVDIEQFEWLTEAGLKHPLTAGLPKTLKVLQWHGQEVKRLPLGASLLASSANCQVQAYAVGDCAFGLQFHSEVTGTTVEDWVQIPAYRADLEVTLGSTGCDDLKQAVRRQLPVMNCEAKIVFDNFLQIVNDFAAVPTLRRSRGREDNACDVAKRSRRLCSGCILGFDVLF